MPAILELARSIALERPGNMSDNPKNDVSALQDYMGAAGRFDYVDFQESAALDDALRRWPLLRRLMQQPEAPAPATDSAR